MDPTSKPRLASARDTDGAPSEWDGIVHHFHVLAKKQIGAGAEDFVLKQWDGYLHMFENAEGKLIGIDIWIAKAGSKLSGMMDGYAKLFTCALKHGATVNELCKLAMFTQFEPAGPTKNPSVPRCTSLLDYIGRVIFKAHGTPEPALEQPPAEVA